MNKRRTLVKTIPIRTPVEEEQCTVVEHWTSQGSTTIFLIVAQRPGALRALPRSPGIPDGTEKHAGKSHTHTYKVVVEPSQPPTEPIWSLSL